MLTIWMYHVGMYPGTIKDCPARLGPPGHCLWTTNYTRAKSLTNPSVGTAPRAMLYRSVLSWLWKKSKIKNLRARPNYLDYPSPAG